MVRVFSITLWLTLILLRMNGKLIDSLCDNFVILSLNFVWIYIGCDILHELGIITFFDIILQILDWSLNSKSVKDLLLYLLCIFAILYSSFEHEIMLKESNQPTKILYSSLSMKPVKFVCWDTSLTILNAFNGWY